MSTFLAGLYAPGGSRRGWEPGRRKGTTLIDDCSKDGVVTSEVPADGEARVCGQLTRCLRPGCWAVHQWSRGEEVLLVSDKGTRNRTENIGENLRGHEKQLSEARRCHLVPAIHTQRL